MVMAEMSGVAVTSREVLAKAGFVDGEVVIERQQHRRNDAVGNIGHVTGHKHSPACRSMLTVKDNPIGTILVNCIYR